MTSVVSGTIHVRTPAGVGSIAYSAATLSVSALVTGVTPSVWSTSAATAIVISGSRFGSSLPVGRTSVSLCLTGYLNSNCLGAEVLCHMNGSISNGVTFTGECFA